MKIANVLPAWFEEEERFNKALRNEFNTIMPMVAEIIPSLACPFRCNECSYRPQKEAMGIWKYNVKQDVVLKMNYETMENAINSLYRVGTRHVIFTGGGEPFTNKEVLLYGIRKAKENDMSVCVYTNGLLLDTDSITKLVQEVDVIRISIYGIDSNGFERYTGCNSNRFEEIFENIKELIDVKERNSSNIQISLSFLLHPIMYASNEPMNFIGMLKSKLGEERVKGIESVRFTPAVDYYNDSQIEKSFFDRVFDEVNSEKNEAKRYGVKFKNYKHRVDDLYHGKKYDSCRACGLYAEIGPDGSMYQCCEKLFLNDYIIGNINEQSIEEIYKSKKRHDIVEEVNNHISSCPPVCKPHEANKQFKMLLDLNDEKKASVLLWRFNLLAKGEKAADKLGTYNYYES